MSVAGPGSGSVVTIRRPQPHPTHSVIERGVVLHPSLTWLVAYFPDGQEGFADPADSTSIRVVPVGDIIGYGDLASFDPAWVASTWAHLSHAGPGMLQAPETVRVWEIAARLARHRLTTATPLISHDQLEQWTGVRIPQEIARVTAAIPHSTIVDALQEIVDNLDSHTTR